MEEWWSLAEPIVSGRDVPGITNSAMDGYALRVSDLPTDGTVELTRIGEALAGHPFTGSVSPGECVRIMTGAPIPHGADAAVMQEQVRIDGDRTTPNDSGIRYTPRSPTPTSSSPPTLPVESTVGLC